MTIVEKSNYDKLENKLYRRGLNSSEWKQIIELRSIALTERGEDPNAWNKNQRCCTRKSLVGDVESN